MTTDIALPDQLPMVEAVRDAIRACATPEDALEAAARVQAAKAWAKAHGQLRQHRLDLLRLEMDALIRVAELGGSHLLSRSDREAAEFLLAMTPEAREALAEQSGATTTAAGMVRSFRREQEDEANRRNIRQAGRDWATGERGAWEQIKELVDEYNVNGVPFEVADVADDLMVTAEPMTGEFMEGVREMCRTYLRRLPSTELDGTIIPRFITSQLPDGKWVRVPTPSATIADCMTNLRMREDQLEQDRRALERFAQFVERLVSYGAAEDALVADVLAMSVKGAAA